MFWRTIGTRFLTLSCCLDDILCRHTITQNGRQFGHVTGRTASASRRHRPEMDVRRHKMTESVHPRSVVRLADSRLTVHLDRVDNRRPEMMSELQQLINDAVSRRDNVAVDEFPDLTDSLRTSMTSFLVRNVATSRPLAAIMFEPFRAARTLSPRLANLHVIPSRDVANDLSVLADVTTIGCELVTSYSRHGGPSEYLGCVTGVYFENVLRVVAARRAGFVVVACIPHAGRLHQPSSIDTVSHRVKFGYSNSYLMYKQIDTTTHAQPLSQSDLEILADGICSSATSGNVSDVELWSKSPRLSFLPCWFQLPTSRIELSIRMVEHNDIQRFYEAFIEAADIDQGFRREEIPTRRFFTWLYSRYWNFVVEDVSCGRWVAVMSLTSSQFSRSHKAVTCDGSMIILPGYRNLKRKIPAELINALYGLCVDIGFVGLVSDTAVDNLPALIPTINVGTIAVGTLPDAMAGRPVHRSTDVVIVYRSFDGVQPFSVQRDSS